MANDPYKYFRVEARELLEQLSSSLVETERQGAAGSDVPRLLRLAHTLKGAARVVKQPEIADLAHAIEDRLAPFREGKGAVSSERIEEVLGLVDAITKRVATLTPPPDATTSSSADEPFRTLRTDVAEMDELLDGIAETQAWLAPLRRTTASIGQASTASMLGGQRAAEGRRSSFRTASGGPADDAGPDLRALLANFERELAGDLERVERALQQARTAAERLRLLPVSTLFSSLERAVRDAARTVGRRVAFRGEGGDIRLDGHILSALQSALVQAVRNAVAHGIEPVAERTAAGKPVEGSVAVEVARRGSRVAIACRDDGRGIDIGAVRRALQRKGAISTPEAAAPEELLRLLLEGGITTKSDVTDVSGRGVGLDVVREVTSRLGGQARLRTQPGEGTTLELVVPVSLSSLEGLVVEAAGVTATIPAEAVRQTVRLDRSAVAASPAGESILYQGMLIPFVLLGHALRRASPPDACSRTVSAVILSGSAGLAVVGVERLLGRASLLVRPLPTLASVDAVVSGLSLDAEGNPQPVLDPARLIEIARAAPGMAASSPAPALPILIVDDSLTTRMLEQSILESAGYSVELAGSGEEALEKARHRRYSLFLVDVEMPGMDGFALLEHFRADADLRGIPAVLVTSRQAPEDRARGTQAGARAYIVKSEFDQAALLEGIRSLVEQR